MSISELIAAKQAQVILLKRHIRMLERMVKEERKLHAAAPRAAGRAPGARGAQPASPHVGRGHESPRTLDVAEFLRTHPGPQPTKDIANAVGLTRAQTAVVLLNGRARGRFIRGKQRGTYALGKNGKNGKK